MEHSAGHDHGHEHGQSHAHDSDEPGEHPRRQEPGGHGHVHGVIDPTIAASDRGIWAVKWSFVALFATALIQAIVVGITGSVALLADTIHNVGDAATAIPLWIAFALARRPPTLRFSSGYGKVEDLAGLAIVGTILASAVITGYEAIQRLLEPRPVEHLGALAAAALVGFIGNEAVAIFRIRVGREIGSAALVADGKHARADGLTSLAVLAGALGVWAGFPVADPLVGLGISVVILFIVWQSSKAVFTRMLDGVDPGLIEEVRRVSAQVSGVREVTEVRARWIGHRLTVEANIAVDPNLSVAEGHDIAWQANHELLHALPSLSIVTIHVDPLGAAGESHHHIPAHSHNGFPAHAP